MIVQICKAIVQIDKTGFGNLRVQHRRPVLEVR
jgi:hypothetical protein